METIIAIIALIIIFILALGVFFTVYEVVLALLSNKRR